MTSHIMRPTFDVARGGRARIDADTTVSELTRNYPDTIRLFTVCGIDVEASRALPLEDIARIHRLELMELLRAVTRAAEVRA